MHGIATRRVLSHVQLTLSDGGGKKYWKCTSSGLEPQRLRCYSGRAAYEARFKVLILKNYWIGYAFLSTASKLRVNGFLTLPL